jgi:hypothetical protein
MCFAAQAQKIIMLLVKNKGILRTKTANFKQPLSSLAFSLSKKCVGLHKNVCGCGLPFAFIFSRPIIQSLTTNHWLQMDVRKIEIDVSHARRRDDGPFLSCAEME